MLKDLVGTLILVEGLSKIIGFISFTLTVEAFKGAVNNSENFEMRAYNSNNDRIKRNTVTAIF